MTTNAGSDEKTRKDCRVLAHFVGIYCENLHPTDEKQARIFQGTVGAQVNSLSLNLCDDCARLLAHAVSKRIICPHDPKPSCKKCATHCYLPAYRDRIRAVMKFSGMYMIRHGRVDLMFKYFS
ncbi:MAG: nitrous oxide-stimulated promoter family protein [Spirochaetes bacterium]|nr:MAG: nitrous oxide-stimulated promoter family protein [Spirochaetota bacterium]